MQPSELEHAELGRLSWDEKLSWYATTVHHGSDHPVRVAITPFSDIVPGEEPDHIEEPATLIDMVASRWAWVRAHLDDVAAYAAAELLEDHNGGDWCEGHPIDAAEFARRLRMTDVVVAADGSIDVVHDDGDLFWGHAVEVGVDADGRPTKASFFG